MSLNPLSLILFLPTGRQFIHGLPSSAHFLLTRNQRESFITRKRERERQKGERRQRESLRRSFFVGFIVINVKSLSPPTSAEGPFLLPFYVFFFSIFGTFLVCVFFFLAPHFAFQSISLQICQYLLRFNFRSGLDSLFSM